MYVEGDGNSDVVERFGRVQNNTECTYARGTRLIGARSPSGWGEGLAQLQQTFQLFAATRHTSDGVVYEILASDSGDTIEHASSTTAAVLNALTKLEGRELNQHTILDPAWWFTFENTSWFVSVFAPCYPQESSRYNFGCSETYILFLDAEAFRRRRRPSASELPAEVKQAIRSKFDSAGRAYDLTLTLSEFEAFRVVKPMRFGDSRIAWWEEIPDVK